MAQGPGSRFTASIIYPRRETLVKSLNYGDTLTLELQAYEQMVVQISPESDNEPQLRGVRAREISRQGKKMSWEVFAVAGHTIEAVLRTKVKPERILLDGKEVPGGLGTADGMRIPLSFAGAKSGFDVEGDPRMSRQGSNGTELVGRLATTIGQGTRASLVVLCRLPKDYTGAVRCMVSVNNAPAEVRVFGPEHNPPHKLLYREFDRQYWRWFQIELPIGRSKVVVTINAAIAGSAAEPLDASWWLWAEQPLKKATLEAEFAESLPAGGVEHMPYPSAMDVQRKVLPLTPAKDE